jgi:small neutral amino acid transporter SnatA (MarC family)
VVIAAVWIAVLVVVRAAGTPAEDCPPATTAALTRGVDEAVGWFTRNQRPDGSFLFRYDAAAGTDLGGYDVVHHAGALSALWQAAGSGFGAATRSAESGTRFAAGKLHDERDWSALYNGYGPLETGASGLYLAALALRRQVTGRHDDDARMHAVARFLVAQTQPDGSVLAYRTPGGDALAGRFSPFATGQVLWALALMHDAFPSEGWDRTARRIATYLATERDDAEDDMPDVSDHWAAYGMAVMARWPGVDPAAPLPAPMVGFVERQGGVLGLQVRWESQRSGGWLSTVLRGRMAIPAGLGSLGEGLGGLWRVAVADPRLAALAGPLAERSTCAAAMVAVRQISAPVAARYPDPSRVQGAWLHDGLTRMDDEQHTMSSMVRSLAIVGQTRPGRPGASTDLPAIVGVLALVAVANPCRLVLAAPAGRGPLTGALAGALALGVLIAVAFAADPLLDALHVSAPSARLAVALVVAATAVIDLFGRVPTAEPALPGLGAALVPVLVPDVLRPALALLAVSVAADHGVIAVAVGGALVGATAVTATAWADRGRRPIPGRLLRWGMAVTAAALVALAIALAVDGVFDV